MPKVKIDINTIKKFLFIPIVFMIFGCDGRECVNEHNDKAIGIIYDGLRGLKHRGGDWSCGQIYDRYEFLSNEYGLRDEDIELLLKNLSKAIYIKNVKTKIKVYKDINPKDKNLKPKGKPVLIIKLDTTQGE